MISIDKLFDARIIIAPIIIGAFLSGIFYFSEGSAIPVTVFQVTLILGFILYSLKKLLLREVSIDVYGLELEYFAFLALIFFSLVYSPDRGGGLFFAIRFLFMLGLTYLILNSIGTFVEFKNLVLVLISISVILAIYSLINTYNNPEIIIFNYVNQGQKLMRSSGLETDPNVFAISFVMPLMLLMGYFLWSANKLNKVISFVLLGVIVAAILITYSRSAWVSVFIGSLLLMKYHKNFSIILYGSLVLAVLLGISETLQELFFSIIQRIQDIFLGTKDDSSNIRIMLLIGAIKMFLDSYMMGVGFQGFSTKFQTYFSKQETIGVYEPHNEYYTVLSELGILGFIIFSLIILKIIRISKYTIEHSDGVKRVIAISLLSSFVSYLVFYLFYGGMFYNAIFFINVGLIVSLRKLCDTTSNDLGAINLCNKSSY